MARLAVAGNPDLASPRQTQPHVEAETVVGTLLLLVVGGVILYPLALIFIQSFDVPIAPGQTQFGLDGWQAVFTERSLRVAVGNTLLITAASQVLAVPSLGGIIWTQVLART